MRIFSEAILIFMITLFVSGCVVVVTNQMGSNNNVRKEHDLHDSAIAKDYALDLKIKNKE